MTQRRYALLALIGIGSFISSLTLLHLLGNGINWTDDYVSNLANEPYGWLFGFGTFVHGWGNLALALGLRSALQSGRLRNWGSLLFGLAALGITLTALFPIDPVGQIVSITGTIHRTLASAAFALELAALFVFSLAFALSRQRHWHQLKSISLSLSVISALGVTWFMIANQVDVMPGLAERAALASFMVWEIWIITHLLFSNARRKLLWITR